MAEPWYAIHVRPRFENCVQMHLEAKGYEVFLPTFVSTRRWSDRVKTVSLPLFPSYLFCRFDACSRLPILVTPGVLSIVGVGRAPAPEDQEEIWSIRQVLGSGQTTLPWPYLKIGEIVRIETGPLEGLTGCVVREKSCDRLIVSVTLLMRSVSVDIDRRWVKPLELHRPRILATAAGH
jgi:transcription antitermination factor NusG